MHRKLVAMANQIGEFFRYQGDEESAMQSIAAHLHHYWAPSMRRDLVACLDQNQGEGMVPLVKACVITYRDRLVNRGVASDLAAVTQPAQRLRGQVQV